MACQDEGKTDSQLKESNYKWHLPGGQLEVTYTHDDKYRKFGAKNVKINGKECFYKFKSGSDNDSKEIKTSGLLEIQYEGQVYILTYQKIQGKDHTIQWCLHLPKG